MHDQLGSYVVFRIMVWMVALSTVGPFCLAEAHQADPPGASSKVSRKGAYEVKQLVNPGFENLPLERKLLVYWLSKAFEAGENIAWKQISRDGLDVRRLMEQIWMRKADLSDQERDLIENYYFEILLFNGLYDAHSEKKFVLNGFTPEQFMSLVRRLGIQNPRLDELVPVILDPGFRPTSRAPQDGKAEKDGKAVDRVLGAGRDFYEEGMTESQVNQLPRRLRQLQRQHPYLTTYPYRRMTRDGRRFRPYARRFRVGGLFSEELSRIIACLEKAKRYAAERELKLINAYQKALRSGRPTDYLAAERLWLETKPTDIDFILGFIETYDDPLGVRGTFQASIVLLANNDPEDIRSDEALQVAAPKYEEEMPVRERFRRQGNFALPQAEGGYLLFWIGGGMFGGPRGFNLPNSDLLRQEVGSRSFTLFNKLFNIGSAAPPFEEDELNSFYLSEYHDLLRGTGRLYPTKLHVKFHEVRGHGSGQNDPGVNPEGLFGDLYPMLEECRAETAALYHILDAENLVKFQITRPDMTLEQVRQLALGHVVQFFTNHLISYIHTNEKGEIRQAHQVGRQIMLNRAIHEGALEISISGHGFPRVQIRNPAKLHEVMGRLWWDLQDIKGFGKKGELESLIQANWNLDGTGLGWRESIIRVYQALDRPKYSLYLNPPFRLVRNQSGQVVDVTIDYLPVSQNGVANALDLETRNKTSSCEELILD
jgi:dipeptidyl-peptidase-3